MADSASGPWRVWECGTTEDYAELVHLVLLEVLIPLSTLLLLMPPSKPVVLSQVTKSLLFDQPQLEDSTKTALPLLLLSPSFPFLLLSLLFSKEVEKKKRFTLFFFRLLVGKNVINYGIKLSIFY